MSILNPRRQILPGPSLLHELIAETNDDAIALEFLLADQTVFSLSYGDFRSASHSLTLLIRDTISHCSTPQIIPVLVPQCPELYIAWRAVLQAGACFCPVSPDVPPERLRFILQDVAAEVVLCIAETEALIREVADDIHCLSVAFEALPDVSGQDANCLRPCNIEPEHPAYVMYTSGSTGKPKGVQVSHASATQSLLAHDEHIPTFKRFLQFAAPTFDVSIFEIFFPFFRGATLVSRAREYMLADLPGTITRLGADAAELTPTVAGTLLRTRQAAPCLKVLLTIGEMLTGTVIGEFGGDEDRPSMLYAMYGPTEAAIHCTIAPRLAATSSVRSIGRPLSTVTTLVLQRHNDATSPAVAPLEEPGELAIAGQLADGYLNRPEQNQAAFLELTHYGRVYLTGDRAICHESGQLDILGRISTGQVKLRGQRVELGEIEEVSAKTDGVHQTVAMVIENSVVLFCSGSNALSETAVAATCKSWLPPFMRPSTVVLLGESFPQLPSGKVDRKRLEDEFLHRSRAEKLTERPKTSIEKVLAAAIEMELQCPISLHDDLWSTGLDSLRAIKVASSLRQDFPYITMKMILTSLSLKELARRVSSQDRQLTNGHTVRLVEYDDRWGSLVKKAEDSLRSRGRAAPVEIIPCTPIQIAMLAETSADSSTNFNTIRLKRHDITQEQVWQALCSLAERYPILRSGFCQIDDPRIPFVMVEWPQLIRETVSLEHPLQMTGDGDSTTIQIHHAIYDGWSWDLIVADLNTIINQEILVTRPLWTDVSRFIRTRNEHAVSERALEYWKTLLHESEPGKLPSLVPTRPNKALRHSTRTTLRVSLRDLSTSSASLRISRQVFVQACWALLLSSYTGSDDVMFGTVVAGRHAPIEGLQDVIGPCLATIPSRLRLDRVKTVHDLLSYIQRQNFDSLSYYDTPLREIRKVAEHEGDRPIFDSIVVWQEGPQQQSHGRRHLETVETTDALKYAAVLEIEPTGAFLRLKITTDAGIMDQAQSRLLVEQLGGLLELMLAHPELSIADIWTDLPVDLLSIANPAFKPYRNGHDLSDAVARWAKSKPNQIAIQFVDDFDVETGQSNVSTVTYRSLHRKASSVMQRLVAQHGIGADDLVCIYAPKSLNLYILVLAVIMGGAGYMCIDPRTPRDRVQHILKEARCALTIASHPNDGLEFQHPKTDMHELLQAPDDTRQHGVPRPPKPQAGHLAYTIFTSGTTGVPKGVSMTRRNLASHLDYLTSVYPYESSKDSLLQACSPAFDVSVFEIFWTWHVGMTLVAASNDVLFRDLGGFINHFGVTHLSMTPSVAALVSRDDVPAVKMLVTAGEPMNSRVFQQWSGRGLYQGYGPSETTNICNVRTDVQAQDAPNNVGTVFSNTSAFFCQRIPQDALTPAGLGLEHFKPVPKGAVGEIWIGGDQVGRGYIDPVLTKKSFLKHPQYGWLYRSGDIGRMLADGSLNILGRDDDQTKIRGQRIELGEINHTLLQYASVSDAATVIDESQQSPRLVSFVVLGEQTDLDETIPKVFELLESKLPVYMVADAVVPVDALPLTRQGKVDRAALIKKLHNLSAEVSQLCWRRSASPADQVENDGVALDIIQALSATLGIEDAIIGSRTSFFQLGMDSLSCIRFARELRTRGLPQVDVSTILRNASLAALMRAIETQSRNGNNVAGAPARSRFGLGDSSRHVRGLAKHGMEVEKVLPCTDLQLSMLAASESEQGKSYRNRLVFKLRGDIEQLRLAWTHALRRHQLLRTIFIRNDTSSMPYLQIVLQDSTLPWYDKGKDPENAPFASPKFEWYKLVASTEHGVDVLVLNIHHALYDAVAMDKLLREIEDIYHQRSGNSPVPFERYLEYAIEMDTNTVSSFWSQQLENVAPCRLGDLLLPGSVAVESKVRSAAVRSGLSSSQLNAAAKQQSSTPLAVLQTCVARLLMQYHQTGSLCFGNVYSGRNLPIEGVEDIIGPCFNTLPVPARAERVASSVDLIKSFHQFNMALLPLQPSSLRAIQAQNSPDGRPFFDALLLLQQGEHALDPSVWTMVEDDGDMDFPFIFEVVTEGTQDEVMLRMHSNLAKTEVLVAMLDDFEQVILDTVRFPEAITYDSKQAKQRHFLKTEPGSARVRAVQNGYHETSGEEDPLSATEVEIKGILLELSPLGPRQVTHKTSIFSLGLDSINAVQVASRLRERGYSITSTQILQGPTLREIAAVCSQSLANGTAQHSVSDYDLDAFDNAQRVPICAKFSLESDKVQAVRPCTPLQDGMISQYLRSDGQLYYNEVHFQLDAAVNFRGLRLAWKKTIERHEMLRTGFVECDSENCNFAMVVYDSKAFQLPLFGSHRSECPASGVDDHAGSLVQPPWQLYLDEANHKMGLRMFHTLYDAQSLDMILVDVAHHYVGRGLLEHVQLAPTISSILSLSLSEGAKQLWTHPDNRVQSTKFPSLHIRNTETNALRTTEHQMDLTLSNASQRCAELGCTLQAVCQSAWARILSAYTGQDTVTFGLTLSGRTFGDERDAAAFPCINTLPFTVTADADSRTLLTKTAAMNAQLLGSQHVPLTSIKRWQRLEDEAFDTILVLQKYESRLPDDAPWRVVQDHATAEFAVSIEILPDAVHDSLSLRITFAESIIPLEAAEIILRELEQEFVSILQSRNASSTAQNGQTFSVLEAVEEHLPCNVGLLHELVERSAATHPSAIALEFTESFRNDEPVKKTWTYQQLDQEGNRIANLLISKGAKTGDLIATCFDKCAEASFAILGVLKAGCAYVAIDPGAPIDRKKFILEDAGCRLLLTTSDIVGSFGPERDAQALAVDDPDTLEGLSANQPVLTIPVQLSDTCYCIFTSGTTGTPKGCLISHESAVQAMTSFSRIFKGHWNEKSRWLQFASFHFDVSVLEQYWSWSVGIRMTSAPRDLILEDLPTFLRLAKITHLDLTPSLARMISPEEVPSLCEGVFIVGGEQVSQDIIDTWGDAGCLYNFYGPSEVTIGCTVHPRVACGTKPTNIGQLWDNVGAMVMRPGTQSPVIRGAVGELCLTGVLVGKGYLNRPELTAEKFAILNDGTRIYHTGDLVRLLHDNSFEFLGRIDDQVKLRGQRLEIGEINQVTKTADESIAAVATLVVKHPAQGKEQLVAFISTSKKHHRSAQPSIVCGTEAADLVQTVRQHCREKLPGYMIPSEVVVVSNIPLSANNKAELKVLRKLYEESSLNDGKSGSRQAELSPRDKEVLLRVSNIVAQRLRIPTDSIKPDSRLFELGLDSVSAIGLARAFKDGGFSHVTVQTVMRSSIVIDLVHVLKAGHGGSQLEETAAEQRAIASFAETHESAICAELGLTSGEIENISPCTPLQEGMISRVTNNEQGDAVYFSSFEFELSKDVDLDSLRRAWERTAESTSILRTHFVPTVDGFAQVTISGELAPVCIGQHAMSKKNFIQWTNEAKRFSSRSAWQVNLVKGESSSRMEVWIFHGLYDGIALDLLLERVARAYTMIDAGALPPSNFYSILPYGPLVTRASSDEFWRRQIDLPTFLDLPAAVSSPDEDTATSIYSDHLQVSGLVQLAGKLNVTLAAIFHAAWLLCLASRYKVSPTLGIVVSGRSIAHHEAETAIGPMFNTIPCSIRGVSSNTSIEDLVQACHKFNVDSLPYQHTPLRQIAKSLGVDPSKGLFDSLFVFQREHTDAFGDKLWRPLPSASEPDYPINLEVEQKTSDGSFVVTIVGKSLYLPQQQCESLFGEFTALLEQLHRGGQPALPDVFFSRAADGKAKAKESTENTSATAKEEVWDEETRTIRREIAALAQSSSEKIALATPSIFELGLDSIDAMKLATRLKVAGLRVPVSAIMRSPTVAGIAAATRAAASRSSGQNTGAQSASSALADAQNRYRTLVQSAGLDLSTIEYILPVTAMQEGLLLSYSKYYNIMPLELAPDTDLERLRAAWHEVAALETILRTRFVICQNDAGEAVMLQAVMKAPQIEIEDAGTNDVSSAMSMLRSKVAEHGSEMPVLQTNFVREGDRTLILLGMPHAAYDGWSLRLLHQKVAKVYQMLGEGVQVPQNDEAMTPHGHLEAVLKECNAPETRTFWKVSARDAHPTLLRSLTSLTKQRPPPQLLQQTSAVSTTVAEGFCQQAGITMQSLGLAIWSAYLARQSGRSNVSFGLVLAGRTTEGSHQLIFPTFNTVLFRTRVDPEQSAEQLVREVHKQSLDITEHQHCPLKETLKMARQEHGYSEIFDSLFTYQKGPSNGGDGRELYREVQVEETTLDPPYAVNTELEIRDGQLIWTMASQEGVFTVADVECAIADLDQLLRRMTTAPTESVLSVEEQRRLVSVSSMSEPSLDREEMEVSLDLTPTEATVRDVLARVSNTDAKMISRTTNIFNLGLDSISAIKLSKTLKDSGLKVPISKIIEAQTLEKIAATAVGLSPDPNESDTSIQPAERATALDITPHIPTIRAHGLSEASIEAILPATAGQEYMLATWHASNGALFTATFWLEVSHEISDSSFTTAMQQLVQTQPMLRTIFLRTPQGTMQIQLTPRAALNRVVLLPWTINLRHRPTGNLFVTLRTHHALYDAVSLDLILMQLGRLCRGLPIAAQNDNFRTFITATSCPEWEAKQALRAFWTTYLRNVASPVLVETDFSGRRVQEYRPRLYEAKQLLRHARTEGVSVQALFFAVVGRLYAASLSRTGRDTEQRTDGKIVLGIYLSNRGVDVPGLARLAAPTLNVVPICVDVGSGVGVWEAARRVQRDLGEVGRAGNCGVRLGEVWEWCGVRVRCVVNWVSVPGGGDAGIGREGEGQGYGRGKGEDVLWHAGEEVRREMGAGLGGGADQAVVSPFLTGDSHEDGQNGGEDRPWVVPSVDVEAKIEDGYLATGIFGLESLLLNGDEAGRGVDGWLDRLKEELEAAEQDAA